MNTVDEKSPHARLVLIAGLQKSGTTLLQRLLVGNTSVAASPFNGVEGHDFWGNVPSHAPREFPAGTFYANHKGEMGHEIPANFADQQVCRVLGERFSRLPVQFALIVNKNPYHTVRLPWLKAVFPECFIVATVRRAVPNVYSLLKKYLRPDERDRPWREDGWYGVKPRHWRTMLSGDLLIQCSNQWSAVMGKLWDDRSHVDMFVGYRQLCRDPAGTVRQILRAAGADTDACAANFPPLHCYDDEYRRGAAFRSKNELDCLEADLGEPIELPPFSDADVDSIRTRCAEVEGRFELLRHDDG